MINLLLLFLVIIYIQFGLFVLIQILIWMLVFLGSNILIRIKPYNIKYHVSRILAI